MAKQWRELTDNQKSRYGEQALMEYQNQMTKKFGGEYNLSYDSLLKIVESRNENFIYELGEAVGQADIGIRRLEEAMERVVFKSTPNDIPKTFTFINGVVEELSDFDFSVFGDAALNIAQDIKEKGEVIGKGIGDATEGLGQSLSFLGKNLKWILALVVGLGLLIGYQWTKKKIN